MFSKILADVIVTKDNNLPASDKLKALQEFRKPISNATPPLKSQYGQAVIFMGLQGTTEGDSFVDIKLIAASVFPDTLVVNTYDQDPYWTIIGADYKQTGLLRLFLKKGEISSNTVSLVISPDGFQRQRIKIPVDNKSPEELRLIRNPPFSIDRITKLDAKTIGDITYDMIIDNRTPEDIYIDKFIIIIIGSNNSGCNPEPIVTFKYDLRVKLSGSLVQGNVTAPGDFRGIPVAGKYVHSYCDGYLLMSYPQSVKVSKQEKISYLLSIGTIDAKATDIVPPGYSRTSFLCKLKLDLDACKTAKPVDEQRIAFLSYSPKELRALKKHHKLDHKVDVDLLLAAGNGISYLAPHISDCLIIAVADNGDVASGSFCTKDTFGGMDSDYVKEVSDLLRKEGVDEREARNILK